MAKGRDEFFIDWLNSEIYTPSLSGVTLASDQGVAKDLRNAWETIFFQYEVRRLRWLVCTARSQPLTGLQARHRRGTVL